MPPLVYDDGPIGIEISHGHVTNEADHASGLYTLTQV